MLNPLCSTVEKAISLLVADFQSYPTCYYNERDIHWSLFHYLKQKKVYEEAFPTELIRAEFPTLKIFPGKRPARGHYDLVILDPKSYSMTEKLNMKTQTAWNRYPSLIKIDVAIEIKLWLNRSQTKDMEKRVDWDIQKLTDSINNIQNAYFLNFVQLNFKSQYMKAYYQQLYKYFEKHKSINSSLHILCIPSDSQIQPKNDNWL